MHCEYKVVSKTPELKTQLLASNYDPDFLPLAPKIIKRSLDKLIPSVMMVDICFDISRDSNAAIFINDDLYTVKISFNSIKYGFTNRLDFEIKKCCMTFESVSKFINRLDNIKLANNQCYILQCFEYMGRISELLNCDWIVKQQFRFTEIITNIEKEQLKDLKHKEYKFKGQDPNKKYDVYDNLNDLLRGTEFYIKAPDHYLIYKYDVNRNDVCSDDKFDFVRQFDDYLINTNEPDDILTTISDRDNMVFDIKNHYDEDVVHCKLFVNPYSV